jgi:hypothetical protein
MPDFHAMLDSDYQAMIRGEFSETVVISNGTLQGQSNGIFDIPYQELDLDTNTVVMSQKPRITIWADDFAFPVIRQCTVTVRGMNFVIFSIENNGEGALTLWLEKV